MFWYALIIEVPRFLIAVLYLGGREVLAHTAQFPAVDPRNSHHRLPTITVLLPGHNEGGELERAIRGLHEQLLTPTQIVVVDDGSTDDMAKIGRRLQAQGLIDVFVSTALRGGKAAAHNLGLTYCVGAIVVIADIDTSFDRDAL